MRVAPSAITRGARSVVLANFLEPFAEQLLQLRNTATLGEHVPMGALWFLGLALGVGPIAAGGLCSATWALPQAW